MLGVTDLIAGIFEGLGKTAVDIRTAITGKDPAAEAKLQELILQIDSQKTAALSAVDQAQTEINKVEAGSQNFFIGGWRPFIGWLCGLGILYSFLLSPLFHLPRLDMAELWTLITGMLGISGMRTVEKVTGTNKN